MENCPFCNEFMELAVDTQNCTHQSIDPQNEFCCPNCDVHFDLNLNEAPTDIGIGRPNLSDKEYVPPEPLPEPTPPSDSKGDSTQNPSQDSNTESTTTPAKPTKPKIDSIYAPPPSKNLPSQEVIKEIESLQGFLRQAI